MEQLNRDSVTSFIIVSGPDLLPFNWIWGSGYGSKGQQRPTKKEKSEEISCFEVLDVLGSWRFSCRLKPFKKVKNKNIVYYYLDTNLTVEFSVIFGSVAGFGFGSRSRSESSESGFETPVFIRSFLHEGKGFRNYRSLSCICSGTAPLRRCLQHTVREKSRWA